MTHRARAVVTSGASRILVGSLVGQGILLAVSPLLTRLYTPQDFGALAAFTGLATVLGGMATASWERAIVIPRSDTNARALARLGLYSAICVSFAVAVAAYALGPWADGILGTTVLVEFWWLLPLTTFSMGIYSVISSLLVRARAYASLAMRNAIQGLSQAVSSVLLGVVGAGPIGLLSGIFVGRTMSWLGLVCRIRDSSESVSNVRLRAVARKYRRFPLVLTWSRALNSLGLQLPTLIIIAVYGSFEAGLYALTIRVLATPIGIVVDAVSQYFEGTFAARVRARTGGLTAMLRSVVVRLFVLGLVPAIVVALFAPVLFSWIFGIEWTIAGQYAQITVAYYLLQFAITPISKTLIVLQRQGTQLAWDTSRMIITALAVLIPGILGLSLWVGLVVLSISQGVLYAVLLILSLHAARQVDGSETTKPESQRS